MALFYADASALVKLVRDEPQSDALRSFLTGGRSIACELVLTEVPRAIRRAAADDPRVGLGILLERTAKVVTSLGLLPLDPPLLVAAGGIEEPRLRALDAIHVAAAATIATLSGFVTHDERQAAAPACMACARMRPGRESRRDAVCSRTLTGPRRRGIVPA